MLCDGECEGSLGRRTARKGSIVNIRRGGERGTVCWWLDVGIYPIYIYIYHAFTTTNRTHVPKPHTSALCSLRAMEVNRANATFFFTMLMMRWRRGVGVHVCLDWCGGAIAHTLKGCHSNLASRQSPPPPGLPRKPFRTSLSMCRVVSFLASPHSHCCCAVRDVQDELVAG